MGRCVMARTGTERKGEVKMKLDEINQLRQTISETEANELLAKGYRIIKIFSTKTSTEYGDEIKPTYVLGLKKEA